MEEFSTEDPSAVKRDKKNLLLTSKDPHLSHLFGDDPKTPNSVASADVSSQSVMEDGGQFHDEESSEPEYRLFEEQSYVPDLSPGSQMVLDATSGSEPAGPSSCKAAPRNGTRAKVTSNAPPRSNGSAKIKPFPCKEAGCDKAYSDHRSLQKHFAKIHASDVNNNSVSAATSSSKRTLRPSGSSVTTKSAPDPSGRQVTFKGLVERQGNFQSTSSAISTNASVPYNGPPLSQSSSNPNLSLDRGSQVKSKVDDGATAQQDSNNHYNIQLLAQSAQHLLQNEPGQVAGPHQPTLPQQTVSNFVQHQSSSALQQIAMRIQLRAQGPMNSAPHRPVLLGNETEGQPKQQFLSMPGQITGVRAQLRKSLSSNGKLETVNAMDWPRMQIPVGGSLDSSMGQSFFHMRTQQDNDPANIDNAPLLKNLLAGPKPVRMPSSEDNAMVQENGRLPGNSSYPAPVGNSWPPDAVLAQSQENLRSPLLAAKRNEFQYHNQVEPQQNPNPSPLHSPAFANAPQFPMPPHNQTTPLAQNSEQQFFANDDIMVNNNNNQQMAPTEESSNLNEMIIESESLVQDLIDEEEASSNQSHPQQQLMSYTEAGQPISGGAQGRMTPPPAYLDPSGTVVQSDPSASQMFVGQKLMVKSEPQSPMIISPIGQRSFFNSQGNPMNVHPTNMQPLSSPTTPCHQVPMQPGMQPHTPTGDAQWQFSMSGQSQNYGSVPQSPVAQVGPIGVGQLPTPDNLVQNINYLPHARQQGVGNPKPTRVRRPSGGAARKNPDGTLSCAICGHSFRSVPALNGHMRVHSSSADKKNKDERQRKTSGSSSGGNESRTPQSLSSPTTPTYSKITPPASMYQNTAAYNSVTVPVYTNPGLYNPALNMDAGGSVVPITQNVNAGDASLVHRLNPQAGVPGLYPYTLQHAAPMQPLLAAANLFARSEPDLTPFMRSPVSGHEDYPKHTGTLSQVSELQNLQFLAHQQTKLELPPGYRNTPATSVILVQPQNSLVPSYLTHQSEHVQASSAASMPFGTLSLAPTSLPVGRQAYPGSPPQEQNAPQLDNIQYLAQPLLQQPSNRSTPLADFADIAVLHDQGQLFSTNSMLVAPLGANQSQTSEENSQQNQSQTEQLPDLSSVTKDFLWPAESQTSIAKMEREDSLPLKEGVFLPSTMAQIHKSGEQLTQQSETDPFIFPVSVPVHCSRDEASVTTTIHSYFHQNHTDDYSNNMSAFHDDPLMQEAINVANPSTILPISMMGGNPGGFRSFRQRHHSEGSILRKTWQPELPSKDDLVLKMDRSLAALTSKTPPKVTSVHSSKSNQKPLTLVPGSKRKVESLPQRQDSKKIKFESSLQSHTEKQEQNVPCEADPTTKKEVWTVPKHAAPNRQRHRRHSADSRLSYKPGSLFSRQAYLSSMQMAGKAVPGRLTLNPIELREKRRPPPLIIPPSVNAYTNGTLFISQLHHRRRPSGDSGSSCGNEKIPPYTPPPMLSPLRFGTGLYYNTPGTPANAPYRQASNEHKFIGTIPEEESEEDFVRSADPKINIGSEYQAELPDLRPRWKLERDIHNADIVWKPSPELRDENATQSRHVEEYLKLACSAAAPSGGCNKEYALHLLHENKGDILASVRQLLKDKKTVPFDHWMASYTYTGAARWTLRERQKFERATCHKDFYQIAKQIGTKSTAECVDYYYHTVKRKKRRIQRPRRFRPDSEEEENARAPSLRYSPSPDGSDSHPSDENDFLQDHIANRRAADVLLQIQERDHEQRNSEVVRRSPPSTAFIKAPPQVNRIVAGMSQTPPPLINYVSAAQHIPQMHSYARQPLNLSTQQRQPNPLPGVRPYAGTQPLVCKLPNCNQSFATMQLLARHQQNHKTLKPYLERLNRASPSPASSPGSVASADADAPQFQCPRCGKTFSKVKSRNAHMKTHGKLAQEKRRQKEEETRRKLEEQAAWRNRTQQQQRMMRASPGKGRDVIQFQAAASPLTKPPGM